MGLHISSLGTLVPEEPWCVFCVTRRQVYGLLLVSDLIPHINTQRHTAHSGASRLTHPYEYILTPTVMYLQELSLLHWMNNPLTSKIYFPPSFLFKNYSHTGTTERKCDKKWVKAKNLRFVIFVIPKITKIKSWQSHYEILLLRPPKTLSQYKF